jgi:protein-disulfide isomerase
VHGRISGRKISALLGGLLVFSSVLAADEKAVQEELEALKKGQEAIQNQIALKEEIDKLKDGQAEIRKQLDEIKKLIAERPAAAPARRGPNVENAVIELGSNPVEGDNSAPLTLVEFTDYQCPYCARHLSQTHPKLEEEYVQTGKIRFVSMDLPLENIHKLAFKAAEAAHCAEEQDKFWEMRERLFTNQKALQPWNSHAEAVGLDVGAFEACLESDKYKEAVQKDAAEARKIGVTGTPGFVVAKTDPNNPARVTGIVFLNGAKPFSAFQAEIDKALDELKK